MKEKILTHQTILKKKKQTVLRDFDPLNILIIMI